MQPPEMTKEVFTDSVNTIRKAIKKEGKFLMDFKEAVMNATLPQGADRGEIIANLMLTYRHLEDASMRLGKVLQAVDGGVSVYDKETTIGETKGVGQPVELLEKQ